MAQRRRQRHKQRQQPAGLGWAGLGVGGAGWLCRTPRKYDRAGSLFASTRKDGPAQPSRPTFDRSIAAVEPSVAPTHGRRMLGARGLMDPADHGYAGRPDRYPACRRKRRWQRLLPLPSALPLFFFFITRRAAPGTRQGPGRGAVRGLERQEPRRATWTYLCVPRTASRLGQPSDAVRKQPAARGFHPFDAPTASDPEPRRRSIITETPHNSRPTAAVAAPT